MTAETMTRDRYRPYILTSKTSRGFLASCERCYWARETFTHDGPAVVGWSRMVDEHNH